MTASSAFAWTPHRFSGGMLALDVANSVVLRFDPARRIDRFDDPRNVVAFAPAASRLSGDVDILLEPVPTADQSRFLALREAIDAHFRAVAAGVEEPGKLADLLEAIAAVIRACGAARERLDATTARSALALVGLQAERPVRICANCQWLFVDFSRNRSRIWCDMRVCGNRAKAGRHYRRHRQENPS